MKNKFNILLILVLVLTTSLIGCGAKEKVDKAINPPTETTESETTNEPIEVSNDIKEQAKKEGVSVKALQKTLDGLAEIGAEKYGITVEEYVSKIESNGDTVLSEWQVASEYMEISITELYEFEKKK